MSSSSRKWVLPVAIAGGVAVVAGLGGLITWLVLRNNKTPLPKCDPAVCVPPFECSATKPPSYCVATSQNRKPGDTAPIPLESGAAKALALLGRADTQWTDGTGAVLLEIQNLTQASPMPRLDAMLSNVWPPQVATRLVHWYYDAANDLVGLRLVDLNSGGSSNSEVDYFVKWLGPDMIALKTSPTDESAVALVPVTAANCSSAGCSAPLQCGSTGCAVNSGNRQPDNLSVRIPIGSTGFGAIKLLDAGGVWLDRSSPAYNFRLDSLTEPGAQVRLLGTGTVEQENQGVRDWVYDAARDIIIVYAIKGSDWSIITYPWKWTGPTSLTLLGEDLATPAAVYDLSS